MVARFGITNKRRQLFEDRGALLTCIRGGKKARQVAHVPVLLALSSVDSRSGLGAYKVRPIYYLLFSHDFVGCVSWNTPFFFPQTDDSFSAEVLASDVLGEESGLVRPVCSKTIVPLDCCDYARHGPLQPTFVSGRRMVLENRTFLYCCTLRCVRYEDTRFRVKSAPVHLCLYFEGVSSKGLLCTRLGMSLLGKSVKRTAR